MPPAFFTSDLHGRPGRYAALLRLVEAERPAAVFLGGDLLPHAMDRAWATGGDGDFIESFLVPRFGAARTRLGGAWPRIFLVMGNDDPPLRGEPAFRTGRGSVGVRARPPRALGRLRGLRLRLRAAVALPAQGLGAVRRVALRRPGLRVAGGGAPHRRAHGARAALATIRDDLAAMAGDADLARTICLFHAPPYDTSLDRAALDGKTVDHVPLDRPRGQHRRAAVHRRPGSRC